MKLYLLYLLSPVFLSSFSYAEEKVHIESVDGASASVTIINSEGSKVAHEGDELKTKDHLKTGNDSAVRVLYPDGSQLILSPHSELEIEAIKEGAHSSFLVEGTIQALIDKTPLKNKNHKFYIRTPVAVMGVRGTHFFVENSSLNSTLQMHTMEGQVDVANNFETLKSGRGVPIAEGETISAGREGLGKKTPFDKKKYLSEIHQKHPLLKTIHERALKKDFQSHGRSHDKEEKHSPNEKQRVRRSR